MQKIWKKMLVDFLIIPERSYYHFTILIKLKIPFICRHRYFINDNLGENPYLYGKAEGRYSLLNSRHFVILCNKQLIGRKIYWVYLVKNKSCMYIPSPSTVYETQLGTSFIYFILRLWQCKNMLACNNCYTCNKMLFCSIIQLK